MDSYNVIGVMSGTSLDGLDIAHCHFEKTENQEWNFKIIHTDTINYDKPFTEKLKNCNQYTGFDLFQLHNSFGNFIGNSVLNFIQKKKIDASQINAISSHGHTVFHQPENKITTQIGNGANISAITKLPVICDFRTSDVALGGQGAPLVPIGDEALFAEYDYCVNLGGIANVSFKENDQRTAFDICPVNLVLNYFAEKLGFPFDKNGNLALSGETDPPLLNELNSLDYYKEQHPKSLGIEWVNTNIFPIMESTDISIENKLNTVVEHIAHQIANTIKTNGKKILFTGGGTFNSFLMERIKANMNNQLIIPSKEIIDFKEALIFAFLGVLRLRNENNCLQSVTGAVQNNVGGCIYQAF